MMVIRMKKIDVFDFDGTIYERDSSVQFFVFCLRNNIRLIKYIPKIVWYFILYYLRIVDKETLKEKYFIFLKDLKNVDNVVDLFWKENMKYIRYDILKHSNNEKVVVSASPEFLLMKVCSELNIKTLIATRVDKNTGKFMSSNCYGKEKVNMLNKTFKNYKIDRFYSDSLSDTPLAKIANTPFLITKNGVKNWKI